jgi:uncharacterized protein (DUF433 family)
MPHIEIGADGKARIAGKRFKVSHLVVEKRVEGWSPEQMRDNHPGLSLAEIHAAFAYYYDHQAEIDREIEESDRFVEEMRAKTGEIPLVKRLRQQGRLP